MAAPGPTRRQSGGCGSLAVTAVIHWHPFRVLSFVVAPEDTKPN